MSAIPNGRPVPALALGTSDVAGAPGRSARLSQRRGGQSTTVGRGELSSRRDSRNAASSSELSHDCRLDGRTRRGCAVRPWTDRGILS
jgi:hypothetical protein